MTCLPAERLTLRIVLISDLPFLARRALTFIAASECGMSVYATGTGRFASQPTVRWAARIENVSVSISYPAAIQVPSLQRLNTAASPSSASVAAPKSR